MELFQRNIERFVHFIDYALIKLFGKITLAAFLTIFGAFRGVKPYGAG
jgi:hypothetical protein